ncbi:MAG: glycosyltransferase, partial [Candidatus Omnitrophota bacterium]
MKISILMPVYNELRTIADVLELVKAVPLEKEIIVVDDFSRDGTREFLKEKFGNGAGDTKVIYHDRNKG